MEPQRLDACRVTSPYSGFVDASLPIHDKFGGQPHEMSLFCAEKLFLSIGTHVQGAHRLRLEAVADFVAEARSPIGKLKRFMNVLVGY
jgi:hypothetical protein